MSLISEALKKAQAQRQEQTMASPGSYPPPVPAAAPTPAPAAASVAPPQATSPAPIPVPATIPAPTPVARESSSPRWGIVIAIVGVMAIVFGGGAALVVWGVLGLSKTDSAPSNATVVTASAAASPAPTTADPIGVESKPAPESVSIAAATPTAFAVTETSSPEPGSGLNPIVFQVSEPTVEPVTAAPAAVASTIIYDEPLTPVPTSEYATQARVVRFPSAQPVVASVVEVSPVYSGPTPTATVSTPTQRALPRAVPVAVNPPPVRVAASDPEIYAFVRSLEVRGVMTGGRKILVFDPAAQRSRAFSTDDIVAESWGLRVLNITQRELEFIDERGATYTKRF